MPSIIGRIIGLSLQTELLIITCAGLVNFTFLHHAISNIINWNHIIWKYQMEQLYALEQRLKHVPVVRVLYWVILLQNVLTVLELVGYTLNFYPILTWSHPYFLLPWLYLRALKALYLKILLVGLVICLWVKDVISLALLVEFLLTEVVLIVPIVYNWQSMYSFYKHLHDVKLKKRRGRTGHSNIRIENCYKNVPDKRLQKESATDLECEQIKKALHMFNWDKNVPRTDKDKIVLTSRSEEIINADVTNLIKNDSLSICTCSSSTECSDNELEMCDLVKTGFEKKNFQWNEKLDKKGLLEKDWLCDDCDENTKALFNYCIYDLSDRCNNEKNYRKGLLKPEKYARQFDNEIRMLQNPHSLSRSFNVYNKTWSFCGNKIKFQFNLNQRDMIFTPGLDKKNLPRTLLRKLFDIVSNLIGIRNYVNEKSETNSIQLMREAETKHIEITKTNYPPNRIKYLANEDKRKNCLESEGPTNQNTNFPSCLCSYNNAYDQTILNTNSNMLSENAAQMENINLNSQLYDKNNSNLSTKVLCYTKNILLPQTEDIDKIRGTIHIEDQQQIPKIVYHVPGTLLEVMNLTFQGFELKKSQKDDRVIQDRLRKIIQSSENFHLNYLFEIYRSTVFHFAQQNHSDYDPVVSEVRDAESRNQPLDDRQEINAADNAVEGSNSIIQGVTRDTSPVMLALVVNSDDSYASTFTGANHSEHNDSLGISSLIEEFPTGV